MERRAIILAESLQEAIMPLVQSNSLSRLTRLVERFGNRERLKGIAVLDIQGNIMASTPDLKPHIQQPLPQAVSSIAEERPVERLYRCQRQKDIYLYPPYFRRR